MNISKDKLQTKIEEIAGIGSYQVDFDTGTWTGSENFINIFGLPQKEEYTQEEFQALVHPEDMEEVMAFYASCLEDQKDFNYEYRCIKPDGQIIHVLSRSNIYYREDGTPDKIIGIKQDITERKLAELQLSRLANLNEQKNKILNIVAHDLRTPISQISGYADLLKMDQEAEREEAADVIKEACYSAIEMIEELLEVTRRTGVLEKMDKSVHDINTLIKESINRFRFAAEKKELTIKTKLADDAEALVDKKKFSRVIDNLLSNAIKFTPRKQAITLTTIGTNGSLLLKVRDSGVGIEEEHIPLLFDEHKKALLRQGTDGETSTGLGLTIVKQIIDMHDAKISVQSAASKGTEFTIELPGAR